MSRKNYNTERRSELQNETNERYNHFDINLMRKWQRGSEQYDIIAAAVQTRLTAFCSADIIASHALINGLASLFMAGRVVDAAPLK